MGDIDLRAFTPYLLAMAAETTSLGFQSTYKAQHGMLRTEWRVLFHLGQYGPLTAKTICDRARLHKTKVSRAVAALEAKRFLTRSEDPQDRRSDVLELTASGQKVFRALTEEAARFDAALMERFSAEERRILRQCLTRLAQL
ncbi:MULTISPECIES: MarR family winged helix-turn-helix transcriptional regulator [Jannaschia]|nr:MULTISPECIES: MarR family transcriptional regulator [unclassified Jannaschia]